MNYNFNGKTIRIPDKDLDRLIKTMNITKEEAIEIWLDDEGYTENAEQIALTQKAKENRITATIHTAKADNPKPKTQRERVKKDDPEKREIIQKIAELAATFGENVKIENETKIITFTIGENHYKIDLIRQRIK